MLRNPFNKVPTPDKSFSISRSWLVGTLRPAAPQAFCPFVPNWREFCWIYEKETVKTAKATSSFPAVWGSCGKHRWRLDPRGVSRRLGPAANLWWNATSSRWGRCGQATLIPQFPDILALRRPGHRDTECCIRVGFLEVVSWLPGRGGQERFYYGQRPDSAQDGTWHALPL